MCLGGVDVLDRRAERVAVGALARADLGERAAHVRVGHRRGLRSVDALVILERVRRVLLRHTAAVLIEPRKRELWEHLSVGILASQIERRARTIGDREVDSSHPGRIDLGGGHAQLEARTDLGVLVQNRAVDAISWRSGLSVLTWRPSFARHTQPWRSHGAFACEEGRSHRER